MRTNTFFGLLLLIENPFYLKCLFISNSHLIRSIPSTEHMSFNSDNFMLLGSEFRG